MLAVSVFATLHDADLVEFGQSQFIRWLPIHDMVMYLGLEKSSGIHFFHAVISCDFVSDVRVKGKKTTWQAWMVCPDVNSVFKKLSQYSPIIEHADLSILQKLVITTYNKHITTGKVD